MNSTNTDNVYPRAETSKAAITSLILSIASFIGLPSSIIAIIVGIIALRNIRKYDLLGKKQACLPAHRQRNVCN